ncbi:MAG: hypothetical protein R3Y35_03210 [Clostridia bacterium]
MLNDYDSQDIKDNKNLALISYISCLFIIPMFFKKHSDFANFHAEQGKRLFITQILVYIAKSFNENVLVDVLPLALFVVIGAIMSILVLVVFSLCVLGVLHAIKGEAKRLPLIGGHDY